MLYCFMWTETLGMKENMVKNLTHKYVYCYCRIVWKKKQMDVYVLGYESMSKI